MLVHSLLLKIKKTNYGKVHVYYLIRSNGIRQQEMNWVHRFGRMMKKFIYQ